MLSYCISVICSLAFKASQLNQKTNILSYMKLKILALMLMTVFIGSCVTSKKVQTQQTTTSSQTEQTNIRERIVRDTIYVKDTVKVQADQEVLNNLVMSGIVLDSLEQTNALKDRRIQELLAQAARGKLTLQPIRATMDCGWGEAGVTNNKLWLNLYQNEAISNTTAVDTTKIVTSEKTSDSSVAKETVKKLPFIANIWFWIAMFCIALLVLFIVLFVKSKLSLTALLK